MLLQYCFKIDLSACNLWKIGRENLLWNKKSFQAEKAKAELLQRVEELSEKLDEETYQRKLLVVDVLYLFGSLQ